MAIFHIFKSTLGSSQYIFGGDPEKKSDPIRGKVAHFLQQVGKAGSEFKTSVEAEIKELKAEIANGHPHIFQDANPVNQTIDSEADPLAALKAQIRAELIAEGKKVANTGESFSAQGPLKGIANTSTLNSNSQDNAPVITQVPQQIAQPVIVSTASQEQKPAEDIGNVTADAAQSKINQQTSTSDAVAALKAKVAASVTKTGE